MCAARGSAGLPRRGCAPPRNDKVGDLLSEAKVTASLGFHFGYPSADQIGAEFVHFLAADHGHLPRSDKGHAMEEDGAVGLASRYEAGIADAEVEVLGLEVEEFPLVGPYVVGEVDHGVAPACAHVAVGAVGLKVGTGSGVERDGFVERVCLESIGGGRR